MLRDRFSLCSAWGLALTLSAPALSWGQYDCCPPPCAPVCAPVCAAPVCTTVAVACPQVVARPVYQTVPVTTYERYEQTVKRPVCDIEYVDQPVTAYRPVTETRVSTVPVTHYQNVTTYRTVQRDAGYWQTYQVANQQMTPCQYDNRPGLVGWFNRTSYRVNTAFEPCTRTCRRYVPNTVCQTVPCTQRVAVQGTRQVSYNVTRMEAYQSTQRVAVRKVRYVDQVVTAMRPVTVMKTVPIGTQLAYVQPSLISADVTTTAIRTDNCENPTRSALHEPIPDDISRQPTRTTNQKTNTQENKEPFIKDPHSRNDHNHNHVHPASLEQRQPHDFINNPGAQRTPTRDYRSQYNNETVKYQKRQYSSPYAKKGTPSTQPVEAVVSLPAEPQAMETAAVHRSTPGRSLPMIVRPNQWAPRNNMPVAQGPKLTAPTVASTDPLLP